MVGPLTTLPVLLLLTFIAALDDNICNCRSQKKFHYNLCNCNHLKKFSLSPMV